jgi:hypothetical protein
MAPIKKPDAAGHELIEDAIAYFNGADRLYRGGAYAFQPSRSQERLAERPRLIPANLAPGASDARASTPGLR